MSTAPADRPQADPPHRVLIVTDDLQLFQQLRELLSEDSIELFRTGPLALETNPDLPAPAPLVILDMRGEASGQVSLLTSVTRLKPACIVPLCAPQPLETLASHLSALLEGGGADVLSWPSAKGLFRARVREQLHMAIAAAQPPPGPSPRRKLTIALVDDEPNILTSLGWALEAEGFTVRVYRDGATALEALTEEPADLAVLDIKMPRMDGMELLRRLRQQTDMPVIFLTSKDEEIDELFGLKMGADDYITKPFSQSLVVKRVRAVLRRFRPKDPAGTATEAARVLERGKLKLDPERHTCYWDDSPVMLTVTEFLIIQALAERPGVVKTRDALMDAAYDDQVYVDDRTIDSHIKRLRKKFKQVDSTFDAVETLYRVGYRYRELPNAE